MCKRLIECISIIKLEFEKEEIGGDVDKFLEASSAYSKWMLYSDYCLDDRNKPNDVVSFALMPFVSEEKIKELEELTDVHQPKDIKNSRRISRKYIDYIKQQPIFSFSFILMDRKFLFGDKGAERVEGVKQILTELCKQFSIWYGNESDRNLKEYYTDIIRRLNVEIKKLHPKANVKNAMDMLLIVLLGATYTANILKKIPKLDIVGWFPDRDSINDACDGLASAIFQTVLYNNTGRRDCQFCFSKPDSVSAPFYDKENRIVDIICGTLADYNFIRNIISKDKFGTVLQEWIADNRFVNIHRIFIRDSITHLSDIKISSEPFDRDLVSIITPTYNCGRFIGETIESVQAQTYQDWEMLIVDDCSTDNTREIVDEYQKKDPRIHYYCLPKNSGAAEARNEALRQAQGRWIAFLDSDDLWAPEKLDRQIEFMITNGCHFSYTEYEEIDEDDRSLGRRVSGPKHIGKAGMFSYCWPGCLTVMYDREKVGLIQIPNIKKNNDYAMWLQAIKKADCNLLKENLARYRKRSGSISSGSYSSLIKWHYALFRVVEGSSKPIAALLTVNNLFWGVIKKFLYVKKM